MSQGHRYTHEIFREKSLGKFEILEFESKHSDVSHLR